MGFQGWDITPGVSAVACFYVISGYAMSGLLQANFGDGKPGEVLAFYRDRLLRLLPQYYFWSLVSFVLIMGLGWKSSPYNDGQPNWWSAISTLTLLPLGFWMYFEQIGRFMLLPQAWSLSVEIVFYATFPLMLRSRPFLWAVLGLSLAMFCIATDGRGYPYLFAYRLPPGALVFFFVGHALFRRDWLLLGAVLAVLGGDFGYLTAIGRLDEGFNRSLAAGLVIGVPLLLLATRLPRTRIDTQLGAASYGAYLCHWMFLPPLEPFKQTMLGYAIIAGLSACCGWASFRIVEAPFTCLRLGVKASRAPTRAPQPAI